MMIRPIPLVSLSLAIVLIAQQGWPSAKQEDLNIKIRSSNWEGYRTEKVIQESHYQSKSTSKIGWSRCNPDKNVKGTIAPQGIAEMKELIKASKFFAFTQNDYPRPKGRHGSIVLEISLGEESNKITYYGKGMPEAVRKGIMEIVDKYLTIDKALLPLKVAYIGRNDPGRESAFRALIQDAGYSVQVYSPKDIVEKSLKDEELDLVIIDGGGDVWARKDALYNLPGKASTIGIGTEGLNYLRAELKGSIELETPNVSSGCNAIARGTKNIVFRSPRQVDFAKENAIQITSGEGECINIALKRGFEAILSSAHGNAYAPLVGFTRFGVFNVLWGWEADPRDMTTNAKNLLVNIMRYAPCVYQ